MTRRGPVTITVKRIVISSTCLSGDRAHLEGAAYHHLCHVLRLPVGAAILLVEETGAEHRGRLSRISATTAVVEIEESRPPPGEVLPRLHLIYGLSRRARTEWVLQKATELGADSITLACCQHSISRPAASDAKAQRWQEILRQATRQSCRARPPSLIGPLPFPEVLARCAPAPLRLLALPAAPPLSRLAPQVSATRTDLFLAVGPEGGFSPGELALADEAGFTSVGLGPRPLRTETAAIALLALLAFLTGRLEGDAAPAPPPANPS